jgi:hypothetical protein
MYQKSQLNLVKHANASNVLKLLENYKLCSEGFL